MTETAATARPSTSLSPDDPRYGLTEVMRIVGDLIGTVTPDQLSNPTPCTEFDVKSLIEHMVLVTRRIGVIGRGAHWTTVSEEPVASGWHDDYLRAAAEAIAAWSDPAKLEQPFEVPWGEFPGAALMFTYTAELATHGWDLATATGAEFTVDDSLLEGALAAVRFIPAEGREHPDVPFGPVVDAGPDAPLLDQIAGWGGRPVLG